MSQFGSALSSDSYVASDDENAFDAFVRIAAQSALPVIALLAVMTAGYFYRGTPLEFLYDAFDGTSAWLPLGALALPASLFVIHLTNRRYGPSIAFAAVGTAWTLIALFAAGPALGIAWRIPQLSEIAPNIAVAAAASLAFAQGTAIVVFDRARSSRWWRGPLHASSWASLAFALTFFTATEFAPDTTWLEHIGVFFAACLGANIVMLIVYKMVRPLIVPLPGGDY